MTKKPLPRRPRRGRRRRRSTEEPIGNPPTGWTVMIRSSDVKVVGHVRPPRAWMMSSEAPSICGAVGRERRTFQRNCSWSPRGATARRRCRCPCPTRRRRCVARERGTVLGSRSLILVRGSRPSSSRPRDPRLRRVRRVTKLKGRPRATTPAVPASRSPGGRSVAVGTRGVDDNRRGDRRSDGQSCREAAELVARRRPPMPRAEREQVTVRREVRPDHPTEPGERRRAAQHQLRRAECAGGDDEHPATHFLVGAFCSDSALAVRPARSMYRTA